MRDEQTRLFFSPSRDPVKPGEVYIRSTENPDEWLYIELQGELQSTTLVSHRKSAIPDEQMRHLWNQPLGEYKEEKGECSLRVGNLLLTGTKKALAKPFIITERVKARKTPTHSSDTVPSSLSTFDGSVETAGVGEEGVSMRIVGIVRHRVLFNVRPKPIISSLPSVVADARSK